MNLSCRPKKELHQHLIRPLIMGAAIVLLVFAVYGQAHASFTWEGGDWGGQDFTPANGDILSGAFTNIGRFLINTGETVFAGSSLVSLTTYETVINGVFYGGSILSPALNIQSGTSFTLNGALDGWSSISLAAGTTIVFAGSVSMLNTSGGTTVFTPHSGTISLTTGNPDDLARLGSDIFLQDPGDTSVLIGDGSITLGAAVPLPSALLLFAPGLVGILLTKYRVPIGFAFSKARGHQDARVGDKGRGPSGAHAVSPLTAGQGPKAYL